VLGTLLPLATGSLLTVAYGKPLMPQGISAGTVLAPTSVGIALRLLGEVGVLQESFGQAIITAAFVDDILSLVLFNILFSLGGEFNVMATVVSPIVGVAFMLLAMVAAVRFWPWFLDDVVLLRAPEARDAQTRGLARLRLTREELLFVAMICLLVLYATITHLLGTHLWGCFIAGMSFACLKPVGHAHHVWSRQTKRITSWMIRIFFACTVAFSIPISKLVSFEAFWKGTIMGLGPCILTKVCCAPFMGRARWVIGWAMVGRAEFAYLIAQMAAAANMLDEEMFAICIWALLYATIFAPFVFRVLLRRYVAAHGGGDESEVGDMEEEAFSGGEEKFRRKDFGPAPAHGEEDENPACQEFKGPAGADGAEGKACALDLEGICVEGVGPGHEPEQEVCAEEHLLQGENGCRKVSAEPGQHPEADLGCGTSPVPIAGQSRRKAKPGRPKRRGAPGANAVFAGAAPNSSGFLCCLFFRKVIVD